MKDLYEVIDFNAPIDSSNRVKTISLSSEEVRAMFEYNKQAVEVYGTPRYEVKGLRDTYKK